MTHKMNSTAFIFPGQGSQVVGMGKSLVESYQEARDIISEADTIFGYKFSDLMWDGPESSLNETSNTQPALFVHSLMAYGVFHNKFPDSFPILMAGHSLGQLSAITAAGGLSFDDGLKLVRIRGDLMRKAGEINPGGMAAILGLDIKTLEKVCFEASTTTEIVQVANDNCPGQVVISGHKTALERAMIGAKAAGAKRALALPVSIAAHSPLMNSIQAEWEEAVGTTLFSKTNIPVISNVAAKPISEARELRIELIAQMQSRVRWTESVKKMVMLGATTFVEFGPGTVLGGLVKRIVDGVVTLPLGTSTDFQTYMDNLNLDN